MLEREPLLPLSDCQLAALQATTRRFAEAGTAVRDVQLLHERGKSRLGKHTRLRGGDPRERFWLKVDFTDSCWNWRAPLDEGYGRFNLDGRIWRAPRLSYTWLISPVPAHLVTDHLCRNRACVHPAHLELVTNPVNVMRGGVGESNRRRAREGRVNEQQRHAPSASILISA